MLIGRSDGEGAQDYAEKQHTQQVTEKPIQQFCRSIVVRPHLPQPRGPYQVDPGLLSNLSKTHSLLNSTNPSLLKDCWPRLRSGLTWVSVVPVTGNRMPHTQPTQCLLFPTTTRPAIPLSSNSPAAQCTTRNDSLGIGWVPPHACSKTLVILSNQTLCPPLNATVFQYGAVWSCHLPSLTPGMV